MSIYNKIIENLITVHPACKLNYITQQLASCKLPIVVREEAYKYLLSIASPNNEEEFKQFSCVIEEIEQNGVLVIFDKIYPNLIVI